MIKTEHDCIVYQDDNQTFTVEVKVDNSNQTNTIEKVSGPGLSGAVSTGHTNDFLKLMKYICDDLNVV